MSSDGQSSKPPSQASSQSTPPSSPIQQLSQTPRSSSIIKDSLSVLSEFVKSIQLHQHSIVRGVTDEQVETKSSMTVDLLDVLTSKNVLTIETTVKTVARIETTSAKKKIKHINN